MGDKQPSVRTLASGEKVRHHPDGTQVLIHDDTRRSRVHDRQQELEDAHAALNEVHLAAVDAKRVRQAAGRPIPHDKRSV
jgi:hypothetical protein